MLLSVVRLESLVILLQSVRQPQVSNSLPPALKYLPQSFGSRATLRRIVLQSFADFHSVRDMISVLCSSALRVYSNENCVELRYSACSTDLQEFCQRWA